MMNNHLNTRWRLPVFVAAASIAVVCSLAYAGGPLVLINNKAVRWPHGEVKGGPLNTQTVDPSGRVLYRVDSRPLGTLTHDQAAALVATHLELYWTTAMKADLVEHASQGSTELVPAVLAALDSLTVTL